MKRVLVIAPFAPYRGGIARHSTALLRALRARSDVEATGLGFSRLYPRRLYPGADPRDPGPATEGVEEALDAVNPLTWRLRGARPDIALIPAWTFFTAPCLGFMARSLRRAGARAVVIAHNAADHEASALKTRLTRWQLAQADGHVAHNRAVADQIRAQIPGAAPVISPHPVYDDFPEAPAPPRRAALELLFFGLVRPYKGLDLLIEAIALSGRRDLRLTVMGEFWSGLEEARAQIRRLNLSDLVELIPGYADDAAAAAAFARADAVVAPYRSATGSGVVAAATWQRRPMIASDAPGLAEAVRHGETGLLFPAGDAAALAQMIRGASAERLAALRPALEEERERLTWDAFAEAALMADEGRGQTA